MKELIHRGLTLCLDNPGLAEGTTVTITHSNAISFAVDGLIYSKASASNDTLDVATDATTGLAFLPQAASTGCVYVVGLNAAGQLIAAQGTIVDLDSGNEYETYPQFPALVDDFCAIGYILVRNSSAGSAWTFATTNWTTTGITTGFQGVTTLPARPVSAPTTT